MRAGLRRARSARHDGGEIAGPVAVFLVEADVLGAVWEGEQARAAHAPLVEDGHGGVEQALRDSAVPVLGQDGKRSEEGERSPAGGYVRADEAAVVVRGDDPGIGRAPARSHEVAVAHEFGGIGHAEEGSEGDAYDAVGLGEIALFEGADFDGEICGHEAAPEALY